MKYYSKKKFKNFRNFFQFFFSKFFEKRGQTKKGAFFEKVTKSFTEKICCGFFSKNVKNFFENFDFFFWKFRKNLKIGKTILVQETINYSILKISQHLGDEKISKTSQVFQYHIFYSVCLFPMKISPYIQKWP